MGRCSSAGISDAGWCASSLTPATMKIAKAIAIWFDAIAHTMTGTRRMRPSVMMFGILNSVASRLPA